MNIEIYKQQVEQFRNQSASIREKSGRKGRMYTTPDGHKYPSVTTVLSAISDKTWLAEWKARVGEEEANRITREAISNGSSMHGIIERHFRNELTENDKDCKSWNMYQSLLTYLNKIDPLAVELPLWSDQLQVAGRSDCIGLYENEMSVIDFKTSRREKTAEQITDYFLQCTFYAMMINERVGIKCDQIVILMSVDGGFPMEFKRKAHDYVDGVIEAVRKYRNLSRV